MGPVRQRPRALFVGLCTLDIIQLVDHVPGSNEKLTARDQAIAAGGPATNAAAAYSHLGGAATLLTAIGAHPLAAGITADLAGAGVEIVDLAGLSADPPTVSSILVTAATGERAVASINATSGPLPAPADVDNLIRTSDVLEFDGHHMDLAIATARAARAAGRLTVFDGGSWKDGTQELMPWIDVAVCSADFHPPGTLFQDPAGDEGTHGVQGVRLADYQSAQQPQVGVRRPAAAARRGAGSACGSRRRQRRRYPGLTPVRRPPAALPLFRCAPRPRGRDPDRGPGRRAERRARMDRGR